jgi:hypothetical protein
MISPSEQELKDRKYLKHMSGLSKKETEELRKIEEKLKPTKKINPNAQNIKNEAKSVQPV